MAPAARIMAPSCMPPTDAKVIDLNPRPLEKRRVLVVDDNLDTVHTTAMLIRSMGHEVQFAINGFAALEVARAFRPHVILLDMHLPDFDGSDIARQLKYEPGLESTRVIAITGQRLDEVRERAVNAGCESVLAKPLSVVQMEDLLADQ